MNYLDFAYKVTKREWLEKVESLTIETEPSKLADILEEIQKDHDAFHHMLKQRLLFDAKEASEQEAEETPSNEKPVAREPMPSFRIERFLVGAKAHMVGKESKVADLTEATCLRFDLQTGSIIKAELEDSYLNIHEVITHGNPKDDKWRVTYEKAVVMIDKGNTMYINRFENNRFLKNHNDELVRHNVTDGEKRHYKLQEGDIVNLVENKKTNTRMISYKHHKEAVEPVATVSKDSKTKKSKELSPAQKREELFKSLPGTPDMVYMRSVSILAPRKIHQRFIDTLEILLGMRVTMIPEDARPAQIETAIEQSEFFVITSVGTTGPLYGQIREWADAHNTKFRPLEHSGVNSTLRNIVEMLIEKEYANSF